MAAIFKRRNTWWVQFYHPVTRAFIRESLGTYDQARAELMCKRVELECELLKPKFQNAELPENLYQALGKAQGAASLPSSDGTAVVSPVSVSGVQGAARTPLDEALLAYWGYIQTDNAARHVQNKLSMLRRFLGIQRTLPLTGEDRLEEWKSRAKKDPKPFFSGQYVDEITPGVLQDFFGSLDVGKKTKRHYREFFHHFFQYCIRFGLYHPTNFHCPNPMAALPSYVSRNESIVFLGAGDVEKQLEVLLPHPEIRIAAAIMIYAGLRRAEALWLTKGSIAQDLSFLSVINKVDDETRLESSLKTGERSVTILPPLQKILAEYLPTLKEEWLVKKTDGGRWNEDAFGRKLRTINAAAGIKWTCLHYRHTYATQRAAEGWPLFRIAKEMGNSAAVVEQYYAGFIRPAEMGITLPVG